jgi:hypothetical protein
LAVSATISRAVNQKVLPWPGVLLHAGVAAHQPRQPARDGQAQAGAAVLARGGVVGLLEGL